MQLLQEIFFHFTEHSVTTTKAQISEVVSIRHESYSQYESNRFDDSGRLLKKSDCELEELIYGRVEKEVI